MIGNKIVLTALAAMTVLGGCAIHQRVSPAEPFADRQICVVDNPAVKNGFLESYRKALVAKGYEVRVVPPFTALNECAIMSTYTANWRWDLAMYMVYAEIRIYNRSKPGGNVVYDATHGGANMDKFIAADKKIVELVNQLLPGGAGS